MAKILIFLVLPLIFSFLMTIWIGNSRKHSQLKTFFLITLVLLSAWFINLIMQVLFVTYYNVDPLIFENVTYISACLAPIFIYFISLAFKNPDMKLNKKHYLFFIIPIITLLILWTNNYHHLFYIYYSIDINDTVFGPYFYLHSAYTYTILILGLLNLLIHSIKTSGMFSKQSILFFIGTTIPVVLNFLGTFKVISMTIYITPISFSMGLLFYAIAIFKYDFLNITPIAIELVVNSISDGYIVLDENNIIMDYNNAFLNFFNLSKTNIKNKHFFEIKQLIDFFHGTENTISLLSNSKLNKLLEFEEKYNDKYLSTTISPIKNNGNIIGTLIFFNDITQHKKDMQLIKDNQTMLIEKERLASLGQMIGGIAHNLKTPIFSISGGLEGLSDLIQEFDSSIEDPTVNDQDMHDIANDMKIWIEKLKTHITYMSDVITAVKGQAVTLSDDNIVTFSIEELFKHVDILMKHEVKNALINLNLKNEVPSHILLKGNINSLVQIINNIISNSIEAYNGKSNQNIDVLAIIDKNNIQISITDYGPGIPLEIKDKLFKEMITTKGKDGTGLGLFMSYSTIKANFHGNLEVESEINHGSKFIITIPY